MDPVITSLVIAATSLASNLAILVKVATDKMKLSAERAETKALRDKDSQELHDATLRHDFSITALRDELQLVKTQQQDTKQEVSIVVKELAVVSTKLDNIIELVKKDGK